MNISFDLETLSTKPNAAIVQIGAVRFDDTGKETDVFLRNVNLKTIPTGFDTDPDTVYWWMQQPVEAQASVFGEQLYRVSLGDALQQFMCWLIPFKEDEYWAHAGFDPAILQHAFDHFDIENPIPYYKIRDLRTIKYLAEKQTGTKMDIRRQGNHHNALDDAKHQARQVQLAFSIINY